MTREEIEKRIDDLEGMTQTEPDGTKWDMVRRDDLVELILLPNLPDDLDEAAERFEINGTGLNKEVGSVSIYDAFKAGVEWRDRQLNWARDLVQAGLDRPEEAVNILKRLKELI